MLIFLSTYYLMMSCQYNNRGAQDSKLKKEIDHSLLVRGETLQKTRDCSYEMN